MLQYFQNFVSYAFRLELLQEYSVDDELDSYNYFLKHHKLISNNNNDRHQIIQNAISRGARMDRIHVIKFPISDYITYELEEYKTNCIVGENILYIDSAQYNIDINHDYRLFDDNIVLKIKYDSNWKYLWFDKITKNIQRYIDTKNKLLSMWINIKKLE